MRMWTIYTQKMGNLKASVHAQTRCVACEQTLVRVSRSGA